MQNMLDSEAPIAQLDSWVIATVKPGANPLPRPNTDQAMPLLFMPNSFLRRMEDPFRYIEYQLYKKPQHVKFYDWCGANPLRRNEAYYRCIFSPKGQAAMFNVEEKHTIQAAKVRMYSP